MHFLRSLLLSGLLIAAVSTNLFAQRGVAGGGRSVASAERSVVLATRSVVPAPRGITASGGRPFPIARGYPAPLGLRAPAAGYTGIRPGALRSREGYGRNRRHVPYTYFFTPYYYPFLDYGDSGSNAYFDSSYEEPADSQSQGDVMAENALGEQVQRLSAEVDQLANNQQAQQAPAYVQQTSPQPPAPPMVVVLRNGQQVEIQSYAVMDQTLWDFTKEPAQKIPLSNIDVPASTKATEAKGGEFPQLQPGQ